MCIVDLVPDNLNRRIRNHGIGVQIGTERIEEQHRVRVDQHQFFFLQRKKLRWIQVTNCEVITRNHIQMEINGDQVFRHLIVEPDFIVGGVSGEGDVLYYPASGA